jgi:ribosomal-protein-alanine N-acetyltransferase
LSDSPKRQEYNKITQFPTEFPRLETERLILRELTLDDAEDAFQNFSDEEVTKYLMEPYTSLEQAEKIIKAFLAEYEEGTGATWAIDLRKSGEYLGTCSLELKPGFRGEFGFDLARAHWGQGYMAEALEAIIQFAFGELNLSKVEAHTLLLNSRAIHLLKGLNFRVDGIRRESTLCGKELEDEVFFSLQRREWARL